MVDYVKHHLDDILLQHEARTHVRCIGTVHNKPSSFVRVSRLLDVIELTESIV
jgi:hypothetical protein